MIPFCSSTELSIYKQYSVKAICTDIDLFPAGNTTTPSSEKKISSLFWCVTLLSSELKILISIYDWGKIFKNSSKIKLLKPLLWDCFINSFLIKI